MTIISVDVDIDISDHIGEFSDSEIKQEFMRREGRSDESHMTDIEKRNTLHMVADYLRSHTPMTGMASRLDEMAKDY